MLKGFIALLACLVAGETLAYLLALPLPGAVLGMALALVRNVPLALQRMREHDIDMLTLGQYLQPSRNHLPVQRFVHPDTFAWFAEEGARMGFKNVASGPLVRSSYHADLQAQGMEVK